MGLPLSDSGKRTVAKLTRLFGYAKGGRDVYPNEPEWDIAEWRGSEEKGPWIRPLRDLVVIQQDPYPDRTRSGLVLFADDGKVANTLHTAVVLAVGKGAWHPRELRREGTDLQPGDRIAAVRYVAYNRIPDDCNERLRIVPAGEVWGHSDDASD